MYIYSKQIDNTNLKRTQLKPIATLMFLYITYQFSKTSMPGNTIFTDQKSTHVNVSESEHTQTDHIKQEKK